MENLKNTIQQEIEKIWPQAKKNISKFHKDVIGLMKKSEKDITAEKVSDFRLRF